MKINKMKKKLIFLAVILCLLIAPNIVSSANVDSQVFEKLNENQRVSVIVMLKDRPVAPPKGLSTFGKPEKVQALEQKKAMIKEQQDKVLSKLNLKDKTKNLIKLNNAKGHVSTTSSGADFNLRHKYSTVNGFSGMVTNNGLEKLMNDPDVKKVYLNREVHITLDQSIPQINADDVWKLKLNNINITGKDETICIIDTGIDTDHSAFSGRILDQYCYCNGGCCPNNEAEDTSAEDDEGHGTHCAGIAAGNHSTYRGVAPEAGIISIKVCNSNGNCSDSDVMAGIDWCVNNASTYNISVISMSLGGGVSYSNYCNNDAFAPAINSAVGQNISVIVSTGNDGWTNGISSPACVQNATPIGASDGTSIASFSNRNSITNLLAPGVSITSPYIGGGTIPMSGTSMSTPHVAGAAALIKQFVRLYNGTDITPQEIENVLNDTGTEIDDTSSSGRNYSRIDVYAAVMSFDTTPPQYSDVSKNDTSIKVNDVVLFYTNWSDSVGLSHYIFSWNNSGSWSNDSAIALTDWSNKSKIITATGKPEINWKIYANDSANNWNNTGAQTFTVNNTAPTQPNLTNPENNSYTNTTITMNWSTSTDVDGDPINYSIYFSNSSPPTYNSSTLNNYTTCTNLTEGETYYWYIIANDGTDNSTVSEINQFTIDSSAPIVTIVNSSFNTSDSTPSITFNYTDALSINATCVLYFNDVAVNTNSSTINNTNTLLTPNSTQIDGSYIVYVNCTDLAGNENKSDEINVAIGPILTIINPKNQPYLNAFTQINGTTTNVTSAGIDIVSLYIYNGSHYYNESAGAFNSSDIIWLTANLSGLNWNYTSPNWTEGIIYNVTVRVNNTFGDYSANHTRQFTYDITPPIVSVNSSEGTSTTASTTTISGNATDTLTNIVNVTVNGNNATLNTSTGAYSLSVSLSVGSNSITVIAYDQAGNNVTNGSLTVTRSSTPSSGGGGGGGTPTVTYEQKSLGTLAAGSSKAVKFSKSDTFSVTEIEVNVKNRVTNAKIRVDTGSLPSGASVPSTKGSVYKYIEITKTGMTDDDIEKAVIKFKVKKSWLNDKGYGKDKVMLHKYHNKKWEKLETERIGFDVNHYYYSAESPGFSTFAITAEKAPVTPITAKVAEKVTAKEPEEETTEEEPEEVLEEESIFSRLRFSLKDFRLSISWLWTIIIIIAVLVIYFVQKRWNVLKISIGMESEAIIAVTSKMKKAEKLIQEGDIVSAKKIYLKILKIYDGLPVKERKWVYKEIQLLYSKIKNRRK